MNSKKSDRRAFLKRGAALAGLAVGSIPFAKGKALASVTPGLINGGIGNTPIPNKLGVATDEPTIQDLLYGGRSSYETTVRMPATGTRGATALRNLTPLQDTIGVITPASYHYIVMHDNHIPNIDPSKHILTIFGMVDRPTTFTVEEIKRFPSVSRVHFLECTGNSGLMHFKAYAHDKKAGRTDMTMIQAVHGRTSTSEWTGVPLSLLLKEVGVQKQASWCISQGQSTEGRARSMTLAKAMDDVFVAYGQNGEALRREQGYPLRLLVPGFQGTFNIKYLSSIKLVDKPYYLEAEVIGYTNLKPDGKASWYESQVGPKSLITFPSDPHKLPGRGLYEISGIAWCGRGKIARVEVSTDNGRTWKDANLQQPIFTKSWTRFRHPWNWDGAETVIMSRCTNEYGDIQPTLLELAGLWGSERPGIHIPAEKVLSFWETASISEFLNNPIQLWRVKPDGSVEDATYSQLPNLSAL
ncbi:MAG: molybdopterin-dependent oxidoreductase [Acidobacteriia bacterium]|nr:molybdopterin-dependent oxidoreductase [Terriglobia bacterium]